MATQCDALIPGDSDIDGLGVLISFVAPSIITEVVATIAAYTAVPGLRASLQSWLKGHESVSPNGTSKHEHRHPSRLWRHVWSTTMLEGLCDLQLFTGLGMTVAGATHMHDITLYHLSLVFAYWNLTFVALWAALSTGFDADSEYDEDLTEPKDSRRPASLYTHISTALRSAAICSSVSLGIYISIILIQRSSSQEWDNSDPYHCYRYADYGSYRSQWLWVAGLILTALGSFVKLFPGGQEVDRILDETWRRWEAHVIVKRTTRILDASMLLPLKIFLASSWMTRQFLSTWAVGPGTPRVTTMIYLGYLVWNVFDAVSAKVLNQSIFGSSGTRWGFGQILPVVLLLAVVFNGLKAGKTAEDSVLAAQKRSQESKEEG